MKKQPGLAGFTLIEVVVALAIGGLVLTMVGKTFVAATSAARLLEAARVDRDREANWRRWLAAALASTLPPTDSTPFRGTGSGLAFTASLRRPDGSFAPARVQIRMAGSEMIAEGDGVSPIVLANRVRSVRFDYLPVLGAESAWIPEWVSAAGAPEMTRIRIARGSDAGLVEVDTVTLIVRDRR